MHCFTMSTPPLCEHADRPKDQTDSLATTKDHTTNWRRSGTKQATGQQKHNTNGSTERDKDERKTSHGAGEDKRTNPRQHHKYQARRQAR